jgi:hypothetical protein
MPKAPEDQDKGGPDESERRSGTATGGSCAALSCELRKRLEGWIRADAASWRAPAFSSYAYLRDELARLRSLAQNQQSAATSIATGAERALDEALLAMTPPRLRRSGLEYMPDRWHPWISLERFYSGSDIEQAWRAIHRAQAALYVIYPERELVPQAEHVEAVIAELPEQTVLLKSVTNLTSQISRTIASSGSSDSTPEPTHTSTPTPIFTTTPRSTSTTTPTPPAPTSATPSGTMLRGIYERAMDVSSSLQADARALRNALIASSVAIFVVLVVVGVAHAIEPNIIYLCASAKGHNACPIDGSPHRFDVFVVELAGMVGGLLSIVIPVATGERISTPYRVFNQQLVLKTLAGAATAVGGVLLLLGGLIDTIKLESTTAILGYAVVFGFAQQIVTGAIDRRANSLAKQTPNAKSV